MAQSEAKDYDTFSKALDVAKAAQDARQQALMAQGRAEHIAELAQTAQEEAQSLKELADNLAATAASVAIIALGTTGASNLKDAYNINAKENSQKITLGSFLDLVISGQQASIIKSPGSSFDEGLGLKQWFSNEELHPISTQRSLTPKSRRFVEAYPSAGKDIDDSNSDSKFKQKRNSFDADSQETSPTSSGIWTRAIKDLGTERFPTSGSISEHKENLAASFESTSNIKPLWEDRYVEGPESPGKGTQGMVATGNESWQGKKAMRQFQLKLQKANLDGSCTSAIIDPEYPEQSDLSDTEVREILKTPKCIRQLKEEQIRSPEQQDVLATIMTKPVSKPVQPISQSPRSASPLLNHSERELYKVSGEEMSPHAASKPRHIYLPGNITSSEVPSRKEDVMNKQPRD